MNTNLGKVGKVTLQRKVILLYSIHLLISPPKHLAKIKGEG